VSLKLLRIIRTTSILLIFLLGGLYASTYIWIERRTVPDPVETNPDWLDAVKTLPDFSLPDLNGDIRSISEWSGRPLVINFWATWCAPCRREMPLLQTLHQERQVDPLEVIGIAIDRLDAVDAFVTESGVTYPILAGQQEAMDVAEQFGADFVALPFTVFTAENGQVLWLHLGELHRNQLRVILKIGDRVASGALEATSARALIAAQLEANAG
jgi:thiol-disulfide isomerase/thioredoxin